MASPRSFSSLRIAAAVASICGSICLRAQVAPQPSTAATDQSASSTATSPSSNSQVASTSSSGTITLTPFEVGASKEQGYFSPTTLAGTRLNSNIADLPSSISVVTKQQLTDTGSTNINDVFMYEANVEGSRSYTVAQTDRNGVHDDLAGYDNGQGATNSAATGANVNSTRVRGLGVPDIEVNNFYSINRAPFDSYNISSVEIERGPNSIIFGSGSPAGITNASWTPATIDKLNGSFSIQNSSWNGWRQTADLNIPLWKGKAALYIAQAYTSVGFQRQPASDYTRRQYATLTIDPFKSHKTHITVSGEWYGNDANDENSLTPTDFITPWLQAGRPIYNPFTESVTYLSTGKTSGPYYLSTTDPNYVAGGALQSALNNSASPFFVPSLTFPSQRPIFFYNSNQFLYGYLPQQNGLTGTSGTAFYAPGSQTGGTAVFSPAQELVHALRMTNSTNLPIPANIASGSWSYPGITNNALYNYMTGPNVDAPNFSNTRIRTATFEITQELLPNLNADIGFFRQSIDQTTVQTIGQVTPVTINVDTNAYLPNGAANPFVGQPFESDSQPDVFRRPEVNTNWRGSLEYTLDTKNHVPGWLEWLGHHRFMTVYSKHDDWNETDRYRAEMVGGEPGYLPINSITGSAVPNNWSYASNGSGYARWYYLGTTGTNGAITQAGGRIGAPSFGGATSAQINTYNYTNGAWQQAPVSLASELFFAGTPGDTQNIQDQKTYFWQSFFWNDRIVGTIGANHDQVTSRQTVFPATQNLEYIGGIAQPSVNQEYSPNQYVGGNTLTQGFVVRPLSHWGKIDEAAARGNLIAGLARSLGFTFNKSNNFNPPSGFQTDYFGTPLAKPTGTEKDYGIEISTPDNRLYAKLTWYKGTNENAPFTPVEQARVEYTDITQLHDWAVEVTQIRDHISDPTTDPNFGSTTIYPVSATQQAEINQLTGLPTNYTFGQNPINGTLATGTNTTTASSKGVDLEIVYNPLPNWTIKVTGGKQQSANSSVEPQALAYIAYRMKGDPTANKNSTNGLQAWTAYSAPDLNNVIIKKDGTPLYLGNFWNGYGYDSNVPYNGTSGGPTTSSIYYQNVVGSVVAATTSSVGAAVPNEHEYNGSVLSNYGFTEGVLKGWNVGTGITWQDHAIVGYYGNTDPATLNSAGQIVQPDLKKPIFTPAELHIDAWIGYQFALPWSNGKLKAKVQLNVRDLTSHGYLLPVSYNFDGTPGAERIIPPRQYVINTTVSF